MSFFIQLVRSFQFCHSVLDYSQIVIEDFTKQISQIAFPPTTFIKISSHVIPTGLSYYIRLRKLELYQQGMKAIIIEDSNYEHHQLVFVELIRSLDVFCLMVTG